MRICRYGLIHEALLTSVNTRTGAGLYPLLVTSHFRTSRPFGGEAKPLSGLLQSTSKVNSSTLLMPNWMKSSTCMPSLAPLLSE